MGEIFGSLDPDQVAPMLVGYDLQAKHLSLGNDLFQYRAQLDYADVPQGSSLVSLTAMLWLVPSFSTAGRKAIRHASHHVDAALIDGTLETRSVAQGLLVRADAAVEDATEPVDTDDVSNH